MKSRVPLLPTLRCWLVLAMLAAAGNSPAATPQSLIFDTDMGGDCDDVGALFVLHGAVERGEAKLLASMGCVSSDAIAPAPSLRRLMVSMHGSDVPAFPSAR